MSKQVALVTGGNRGLGKAICEQLAAQGIHVILTVRDIATGKAVVNELIAKGFSAECRVLDVTDQKQINSVVEHIHARYGRIDILVNNAGIALDKWRCASQLDIDVFKATMDVNVYACLALIQACLPLMKARGYGRIVNMSSELASLNEMDKGMTLAYRASKTTLNAITKVIANELADQPNIKINSAEPGWVKTDLGGAEAPLTPAEGAVTPVWLATLPQGGPSGGFYREQRPYPW